MKTFHCPKCMDIYLSQAEADLCASTDVEDHTFKVGDKFVDPASEAVYEIIELRQTSKQHRAAYLVKFPNKHNVVWTQAKIFERFDSNTLKLASPV